MGFFKLAGMTFGNIFSKKETLRYPYESKEPYSDQKGTIVQAHKDKCNLCMICMKKCPVGAIVVDKPNKTWAINHYECVQCHYCIDSCPKKCLEMDGAKPPITLKKEMEVVNIPLEDKKPKTASSTNAEKPAAKPSTKTPAAKKVTTNDASAPKKEIQKTESEDIKEPKKNPDSKDEK